MEEMITILKSEYDNLKDSQRWLSALENAGVDNWSCYDYARDLYRDEEEE